MIFYHFLWENLYYYLSYSSKFLSRSMRNDVYSQSHLILLDESWVLCQCLVYGCHLSQLAGVRTENHAHWVTARCTAKPKSRWNRNHGETEITPLFSLTPSREPSHDILRTAEIYFPNTCGIHRAPETFPPTFLELGYGPEVISI